MPNEWIGKPKSVAITSPAETFSDIFGVNFDPDVGEIIKSFGGVSRQASITLGNDNTTLEFKTRNGAAVEALAKGMELTGIVVIWQAPAATPAAGTIAVGLQHAKLLTLTISHGYVMESIKVETAGGDDSKPAEYTVKIGLCELAADGTAATATWALASGA